jgi:hypothetical protein
MVEIITVDNTAKRLRRSVNSLLSGRHTFRYRCTAMMRRRFDDRKTETITEKFTHLQPVSDGKLKKK